jgi:hypothetical protein
MAILSRIGHFLDDSSSVPPGMLPIQPTPEWARVQAMAMLDGHLSAGTEALGMTRFLAGWLKGPTNNADLSAPHVWSTRLLDPNATLATLLAGPTSDPRRNGVLTDQQLLILRPTISTRGTWMSANLWCSLIPAPPPNIPPGGPKIPGATRRQQLESDTSMPVCRSCHTMMDPQAYALEHFDQLGIYRDVDNGTPVDASGMIQSLAISFGGIDDLAPQLAESCLVAQCFARLMMSHAFSVDSLSSNLPFTDDEVNHAANVFANSHFSIRALVAAIVTTPSFLR